MPFQHLTDIQIAKHEPASNTAAVVTVTAPSTSARHYLYALYWSYDGTPTNGSLTTSGLNGSEYIVQITQSGPDMAVFPPIPIDATLGFTATLAAGGSGVTGKVMACYGTFPIT